MLLSRVGGFARYSRYLIGDLLAISQGELIRLFVVAGPTGLKRAFANLLANARKYAGGARATLSSEDGHITVTIDDAGAVYAEWDSPPEILRLVGSSTA